MKFKLIYIVILCTIFTLPFHGATAESVQTSCLQLKPISLAIGSRGSEVILLQKFLNLNGYLLSEPTGYFGNQTASAVRAFQKENKISSIGTVGPLTRAKITALSCVKTVTSTTTSSVTKVLPVVQTSPIVTPQVSFGDLVISDLIVSVFFGESSSSTRNGYFYVKVKNTGSESISAPSGVRIAVYKGSVSGDTFFSKGEFNTGAFTLAPNATKDVVQNFSIDRKVASSILGTFNAVAVVDTQNSVKESNESNNTFSKWNDNSTLVIDDRPMDNLPITNSVANHPVVAPQQSNKAYVTISNVTCPSLPIRVNDTVECQVTVTNSGVVDIGVPFTITNNMYDDAGVKQVATVSAPFKVGEIRIVSLSQKFHERGQREVIFGTNDPNAAFMDGIIMKEYYHKYFDVSDISNTESLSCPQTVTTNSVSFTLSPCAIDIQMVDGQGNQSFATSIVPSVQGTSFSWNVAGEEDLPSYTILGGSSGSSYVSETLDLRVNDAVLSADGNLPRVYTGYLPITVNSKNLYLNLKITVNPGSN